MAFELDQEQLARAVDAMKRARALVITAGAGMGVDSGLPDFRGVEGFWNAYPAYRALGLNFIDLANPQWFKKDPTLAWGFYGHRLSLYRKTVPHRGFSHLLKWAKGRKDGYFVFTSNVDGQFQRAGFSDERIYECHGAIDFAQCTQRCGVGVIEANFDVQVDEQSFRAVEPLPKCPSCQHLLRPTILMFGDWGWDSTRHEAQERKMDEWMAKIGTLDGVVVVECGAGTAIPTVRGFGEQLASRGATLIRINVREPNVPSGQISLSSGALFALDAIASGLGDLSNSVGSYWGERAFWQRIVLSILSILCKYAVWY